MIPAAFALLRPGNRSRRRGWVACLLGMTVACGDQTRDLPGDETNPMPGSMALPTVSLAATSAGMSAPSSPQTTVVLGDRGDLLYSAGRNSTASMTLINPIDRTAISFGALGEGPGETRFAMPMGITDSSVMAFDFGTMRTFEWRRDGELLLEKRTTESIHPHVHVDGRGLLVERLGVASATASIFDIEADEVLEIVGLNDTIRASLFARADDPAGRFLDLPILAGWSGGILMANGNRFEVAAWDWDGKFLWRAGLDKGLRRFTATEIDRTVERLRQSGRSEAAIARARADLEEGTARWFANGGAPGIDSEGRLWIVSQTIDSAFAELFQSGEHIGRLAFECPGFEGHWDVSGEWMALVCESEDDEAGAEVRLYRLSEDEGSQEGIG